MKDLIRRIQVLVGDREGASLALVAVLMVSVLASMALAVDVALGYTARSEAQRVADAAALAGASAFIEQEPGELASKAVAPATRRAKEFAAANLVRNQHLDTLTLAGKEAGLAEDVTVQVVPDSLKVRVWVRQSGIKTFFARLLGIESLAVQAASAAVAAVGGSAQCVWPFSGPDLWQDTDGDDGDGVPESGEDWDWDPDVDIYEPWDGADGGTGYGSPVRNGMPDDNGDIYRNDYGRPLVVKTANSGQGNKGSNPGDLSVMMAPGNFMLWAMPDSEAGCSTYGSGAEFLYNNMTGCNECRIAVTETFDAVTEPGQKWGRVRDAIDEVISRDPGMSWDSKVGLDGGFRGSTYPEGVSPRLVPIALAHPDQHPGVNGRDDITFNNLALVFLEGYDHNDKSVHARFVGYASGSGGPGAGSLIKYLRLVE